MCFYNDHDWYAETYSDRTERLDTAGVCFECGATIAPGERRRVVCMEESDGRCLECDEYRDCKCERPDYGESFNCQVCRKCCALLASIRLVERRDGCPSDAQQPSFGELCDALANEDGARYYAQARKLFPLLVHRFLGSNR